MRSAAKMTVIAALLAAVWIAPGRLSGADARKDGKNSIEVPVITMDGGRRLQFVGSISTEQQVNPNRSFWKRAFDLVAGAPEYGRLVRPSGIAVDSRGRIIVTDPGAMAVHIFDFDKKQYRRIERGKGQDLLSPIGVAVDAHDNIYVSDSRSGRIFVFDANGKFRRFIGAIADNEGLFKRATGIAIDAQRGELFVSDTLRDRIFVLDLEGRVLRQFGERGSGPGEFNFPTEIVLRGGEVFVVDAMNFRVQIFDRAGHFLGQFGELGDAIGYLFRPKGLSVDSEGNIYLADAALDAVQVFGRDGTLLYTFGGAGSGPGQLELPAGLWIDAKDRVYVADSYNQRVEVYQFTSAQRARGEQR